MMNNFRKTAYLKKDAEFDDLAGELYKLIVQKEGYLQGKLKECDVIIQNKLEQFYLFYKCLQKCQENEDYTSLVSAYISMRSIVGDLREYQEQIFEKVPEYCKIFETIEKFEPFTIFMQQPGHRDWCDINPHTLRGCTCDKEQK